MKQKGEKKERKKKKTTLLANQKSSYYYHVKKPYWSFQILNIKNFNELTADSEE